jgi:hypothetical protein
MNPRDIFGVLVRAAGLWLIVQSAMLIVAVFTAPILILALIIECGVGCMLLLGADHIVRAAYEQSLPNDFVAPSAQQ